MFSNEKEKNLAQHIANNLNSGISRKAFCEEMSREHRFLQYEFTNMCLWWLEKCREMYNEGNYDGRNEYACKAGKILMDYYDSPSRP